MSEKFGVDFEVVEMEKMTLLSVLVGMILLVTFMETWQLNNLNTAFGKMSATKASPVLTASSPIQSSGDSEYEKMMAEMHPGQSQQQAAAPQAAQAQTPALSQIQGLPDMVGGC